MNKLFLVSFFFAFLFNDIFGTIFITQIGSMKISIDTTQSTHVNSVSIIGGKLYLGDGTNTILINTSNFVWPSAGSLSPLAIDSTGTMEVLTNTSAVNLGTVVVGSLTAAASTGEAISLGKTGKNKITFSDTAGINISGSANIIMTTASGYNMTLQSGGTIILVGSGITNGPANSANALAISSGASIGTATGNLAYLLGGTTKNYIKVDNYTQSNGITLNGHSIKILGISSILPPLGYTNPLGIDGNGNITLPTISSLGSLSNNQVLCPPNANGDISITSKMYDVTPRNIIISADGDIKCSSQNINPSNFILCIDQNSNLTTTDQNLLYSFGDNTDNAKNYIVIDNTTTSNGINFNGLAFYFTGNNALLPAEGNVNTLTINSVGEIGIISSSKNLKKNIEKLTINDTDFTSLFPVSYNFINRKNDVLEFGFLAEDLIHNPTFKHTVIFDQDNNPMSINYNAIFTAGIAKLIYLLYEVEKLKNELEDLKKIVQLLKK